MIKNYIPRRPVEIVERSIEFTDAEGSGFSFDCDENGTPVFRCDGAKENYEYAMQHPEIYTDQFNEFVTRRRMVTEPASGTCRCGESIELWDQYQGACECPKCGRWYNLFGQELLKPEYWED